MPFVIEIPGVSDDQLILTSWGNSVKNELNTNTVKANYSGAQTIAGPLTVNGGVTANANPAIHLKGTGEQPYLQWESVAGTRFAYLRYLGPIFKYNVDHAAGVHRFTVAETVVAEIDAAGNLDITGGLDLGGNVAGRTGIFARNDNANQIVIADYSTLPANAGIGAHAYISFYPDAVSATSFGTRGGYVGFNGEGFQIQADIGPVIVQSLAETVGLDGQTAVTSSVNSVEVHRTVGAGIYVGKATSDDDIAGITILGPTAAAGFRNSFHSTANAAGNPNVYLRRTGTAVADNQIFVQFSKDSGTPIGSITMNGTAAVQYNTTSDYRQKDDLGPIDDPVGRVMALQPKRLRWKPDATEFDGFIAHEVETAAPYAVSGAKDAVLPPDDPHDPGGIDPQQLDRSALVPLLTAALQGALTQIEALEARVAALEGTPA